MKPIKTLHLMRTDFCIGPIPLSEGYRDIVLKNTIIHNLMCLTGIYNLLNRNDLRAFIKRTALLFMDVNPAEQYFLHNRFFEVHFKNIDVCPIDVEEMPFEKFDVLHESDFIRFHGATTINAMPNESEEDWILHIIDFLKEINNDEAFYGWIHQMNIYDATVRYKLKHEFSDQDYATATLLADCVMKSISEADLDLIEERTKDLHF